MKRILLLTIGASVMMFSSCKKKIDSCIVADKSTAITGEVVQFTNCTEKYLTAEWDFGDGGNTGVSNPTHVFSTAGKYTVVLRVTNKSGNSSEITQSITVNDLKITSIEIEDFDFTQQYPFIDVTLGGIQLSSSNYDQQNDMVTFASHPSVTEILLGSKKTITFKDGKKVTGEGFEFTMDRVIYSSSGSVVSEEGVYFVANPFADADLTAENIKYLVEDAKTGVKVTFKLEKE